mgnify:CR=1 FL=1
MKFTYQELRDLTTKNGGAFSVKCIDNAYIFCERLSKKHYENFPVGSILIPHSKRKYFFAVYAVARISDDIADELLDIDPEIRIEMLNQIADLINDNRSIDMTSGNPIIMALMDTMKHCNIPARAVTDLLKAFKMDLNFRQPKNWDEIEYYCKHSANPVGEVILRIFDNYNETTAEYSDAICTGLQLVNFWQDLSRDIPDGRIYIPESELKKHSIEINDLLNQNNINNLESCLIDIFDKTEKYFVKGKNLIGFLTSKRLKAEIAFTVEGGLKILKKNRILGKKLLSVRPTVKILDLFPLFINVILNHKLI